MIWFLNKKRSSRRPEMFYEKDVLKSFVKITWTSLCQSLFLDKVAGLRSETLFKKWLQHRYFPDNFSKCLRTHFYKTPLVAASFKCCQTWRKKEQNTHNSKMNANQSKAPAWHCSNYSWCSRKKICKCDM